MGGKGIKRIGREKGRPGSRFGRWAAGQKENTRTKPQIAGRRLARNRSMRLQLDMAPTVGRTQGPFRRPPPATLHHWASGPPSLPAQSSPALLVAWALLPNCQLPSSASSPPFPPHHGNETLTLPICLTVLMRDCAKTGRQSHSQHAHNFFNLLIGRGSWGNTALHTYYPIPSQALCMAYNSVQPRQETQVEEGLGEVFRLLLCTAEGIALASVMYGVQCTACPYSYTIYTPKQEVSGVWCLVSNL